MRKPLNLGKWPSCEAQRHGRGILLGALDRSPSSLTIHDDPGLLGNSSLSSVYNHATVVRGWLLFTSTSTFALAQPQSD